MNKAEDMRKVNTACTLDCWDSCSITASVKDNRVVSIAGNSANHVTGSFVCPKGRKHIDMLYHPKRLKTPLVKKSGRWLPVGWDEVLDLVAEKLELLRSSYPTTALLHCRHGGSTGLLKSIEGRFFNAYGGVTEPTGSLCQGAGAAAQLYDFGNLLSSDLTDLVNSRVILIWGRNPAETGIHLMPFIKRAKDRGAAIAVIDPNATETVKSADMHVSPLPGTDGALALSMAHVIIKENYLDNDFISSHVTGFREFRNYVEVFDPETAAAITGISREGIVSLARLYGNGRPSSVLIGYGVQRYSNGGYTVRAIDALGALTGNIGVPGGGIYYGNNCGGKYIDGELLSGNKLKKYSRSFPRPRMAEFIENAEDPPVRMIFTSRANPITQGMDSERMIRAFSKVDFKVTVDFFMNDTAQASDVVLPCRHSLENEDIVFGSLSHCYINYCNRAVEPEPWVPSELWIVNELARRLKLEGLPIKDEKWWLEKAIAPLTKASGITLDDLKAGPVMIPGVSAVAWEDKKFETPSGKFELYSQKALEDGYDPLPVYIEKKAKTSKEYPYWLLTPHTKSSLHSQHYVFDEQQTLPVAYINPDTGMKEGLENGAAAVVFTGTASLECRVEYREGIRKDVVMLHEGCWIQKGGGVNRLIPETVSEMGCHAAYYDCSCGIKPVDRQPGERERGDASDIMDENSNRQIHK